MTEVAFTERVNPQPLSARAALSTPHRLRIHPPIIASKCASSGILSGDTAGAVRGYRCFLINRRLGKDRDGGASGIPVAADAFPVPRTRLPVWKRTGNLPQALQISQRFRVSSCPNGPKQAELCKNSLLFSLLSGNSHSKASPTDRRHGCTLLSGMMAPSNLVSV